MIAKTLILSFVLIGLTGCNFIAATKNNGAYNELFNGEMTPVNTDEEKQKLLERQVENGR